jgi:hypothetical protein
VTRAIERALARTGMPRPSVEARAIEDETGRDIALLTIRDVPADRLADVARALSRAARTR